MAHLVFLVPSILTALTVPCSHDDRYGEADQVYWESLSVISISLIVISVFRTPTIHAVTLG